jgi:hypothetical protein
MMEEEWWDFPRVIVMFVIVNPLVLYIILVVAWVVSLFGG